MFTKPLFRSRFLASLLALSLLIPLCVCGCGDTNQNAAAPPPANNGGGLSNMSTGKKLALLAGTAALIYLYNKHKAAKGTGPQGQYYRSSNGRVYYRDANGKPVWVTPPAQGIQVSQDEYDKYQHAAQQNNWNVNPSPAPTSPPGPGR